MTLKAKCDQYLQPSVELIMRLNCMCYSVFFLALNQIQYAKRFSVMSEIIISTEYIQHACMENEGYKIKHGEVGLSKLSHFTRRTQHTNYICTDVANVVSGVPLDNAQQFGEVGTKHTGDPLDSGALSLPMVLRAIVLMLKNVLHWIQCTRIYNVCNL